MDTIIDDYLEKQAQMSKILSGAKSLLTGGVTLGSSTVKAYLALAAALGLVGGFGIGTVAHAVKQKNPKITTADRKRLYYDKSISAMRNENWLNSLMAAKKKLETARLSDEERSELEKEYIKLING